MTLKDVKGMTLEEAVKGMTLEEAVEGMPLEEVVKDMTLEEAVKGFPMLYPLSLQYYSRISLACARQKNED